MWPVQQGISRRDNAVQPWNSQHRGRLQEEHKALLPCAVRAGMCQDYNIGSTTAAAERSPWEGHLLCL
jgi:hypothetical protein